MRVFSLLPVLALLCAVPDAPRPGGPPCEADNGGLSLPTGFCARLVVSGVGGVRQIAVAPNGDVYAALAGAPRGSGVLALRDRDGDGRPDERLTFGPGGGNDVKVHDGYLYFAETSRIVRWRLSPSALRPAGPMETVVSGLPDDGGHVQKSMAFAGETMYVNVGSRTNSCQESDRAPRSPGRSPCTELDRRAGIWSFAADRLNQTAADGVRFATGLRNAMALAVDPSTGVLWAGVMGRDQLGASWGFSDSVNAEDPGEEFGPVRAGNDYGWPYCYYSTVRGIKIEAPEYGGDGAAPGSCGGRTEPAIAFPGHWAPIALAFDTSSAFGPAYRGGAFLAFHGSWNRAPLPQAGYRVVFIPFRDGRPSGPWHTFAIGAAGPTFLRAAGVAVAPDGSLYIGSDARESIWRVFKR